MEIAIVPEDNPIHCMEQKDWRDSFITMSITNS